MARKEKTEKKKKGQEEQGTQPPAAPAPHAASASRSSRPSRQEMEVIELRRNLPPAVHMVDIDMDKLIMPPKYLFEERMKVFLGILLFILFLLFFGGIAWYLLALMDAGMLGGTVAAAAIGFFRTAGIFFL